MNTPSESNETQVEPNLTGLHLGSSETPFEAAATMFGLYRPKFEELVKTLSTGELRRVLNALVQYPLNEREFINEAQRVRDTFAVGQSLLEAKWLMLMQSMMEAQTSTKNDNSSLQEEQGLLSSNEGTSLETEVSSN
jgi:hypothetical protein